MTHQKPLPYQYPKNYLLTLLLSLVMSVLSGCERNAAHNNSATIKIMSLQAYTLNPNLLIGISLNTKMVVAGTDGTLLGLDKSATEARILQPLGVSQQIFAMAKNVRGDKVIAAGAKGLLLTSDDGASHWKTLETTLSSDIISAEFHPILKRWFAISVDGKILSLDENFKNLIVSTRDTPTKIQKIIYSAASKNLFLLTDQDQVWTSDNGQDWQVALENTQTRVIDLISTHQGTNLLLTADGFIFRSTHQHKAWQKILLKESLYLSGGIVDATNNTANIFSSQGDIFFSADDGEHWTLSAQLESYINSGLVEKNTHKNIVVGNNGLIASSDDGGKSWLKHAPLTTADIDGVVSNQAQHMMAFGKGGLLIQSLDGGGHWRVVQEAITSFIQEVIATADKNTFIAVGSKGLLQQSTDQGYSWHAVASDITQNDYLLSVIYDKASQSFIAAGPPGTIMQSQDNGASWHTRLHINDSSAGYFHQLVTNNQGVIVAIAGPGTNHYSEDGGISWKACSIDSAKQLFHGSYNHAHKIFFAAGQQGSIQTSTDGISWKLIDIQSALDFQTTYSLGKRMFVAGQGGAIIYSDDAGESWQQGETPTQAGIQYLAATPSGTLIATGIKGLMLRSVDGGAHWQQVYSTITDNLRQAFVDTKTNGLYVPTRGGAVLYSEDDGKSWISLPSSTGGSLKGLVANPFAHTAVGYGERLITMPLLD